MLVFVLVAAAAVVPASAAADPGVAIKKLNTDADAVRAFWTPERMAEAERNGAPPAGGEADGEAEAGVDIDASVDPQDAVRVPLFSLPGADVSRDAISTRINFAKKIRKRHYKARNVKRANRGINRTHGRAFFTFGSKVYACSATVVKSASRSLVWTAAHCLADASRKKNHFANQWVFVPAYRNGNTPLGVWPATYITAPRGYLRSNGRVGNKGSELDFGAAVIAPDEGTRLQNAVGGRPIAFKPKRKQRYKIYGYPAAPGSKKMNGEKPLMCRTRFAANDQAMPKPRPILVGCEFDTGASGGGWINRRGKLVGVTSYKVGWNGPPLIGGTYHGPQARKLYRQVSKVQP